MVQQPEGLDRWGRLVLRAVLGGVFVLHGAQKLFGAFGGGGINGTAAFFQKFGIAPGLPWAWVVGSLEFFGGLLIFFGLLTRICASLIVIEMVVAGIKVNSTRGFFFDKVGWEITLVYGAAALAVALLGAGPLSVDRAIGLEKRAG